jgi:hypothetical protein
MQKYKWMICVQCNRFVRNVPEKLERHMGHRYLRWAHDEPWYHILYCPELLLDWWKIKWSRVLDRARTI